MNEEWRNHEKYIQKTYLLAKSAQESGNHPFGALLVMDDQVRITAENTVNTDHDITRHAELNLVSAATRILNPAQLGQSVLYTSTEPCAMCTGAIYWSGISKIVYGCSAAALGKIAGGSFVVPCRDLLKHGKAQVEVVGPVLEEPGKAIHHDFW